MALDPHGLLAAALSLRVTADTTGLDAELASKLTVAERQAALTADRVSASAGRIATVGVASSSKLEAATLRQTAAQETYNRLLRAGEDDTIRLARAQASLITAQSAVRREQARLTETQVASQETTQAASLGILGGTKTLLAGAAGLGLFTALRGGITTYERLTASVKQYQRVTGESANESSRMVAILDRYGLTGDRATQAMLRFGKNIDETPQKLKEFGVQIARNADGTTNLTQTLLNANTAFHNTPDAATRASLALTLFGRGGQTLLPILAANKETLQGFMDEAQRAGLIFSQNDLTRAKQFAEAQKSLTASWQGFEIVLARGVVPALHDVTQVATGALNLFTDHRTIGEAVLRIGEVAGALYVVNKALKAIDAARDSTLFTKLFNVGETQAQTAANTELAASYTAIGAAAGGAVPEVAALDAAEIGGGVTGGAGVLGEMAGLRATIPTAGAGLLARLSVRGGSLLRSGLFLGASAIDPALIAAAFAGPGGGTETSGQKSADTQFSAIRSQYSYQNGSFYVGGQRVIDPKVIAELETLGIPGAPASLVNKASASGLLPKYGLTPGQANTLLGGYARLVVTGQTAPQVQAASRAQFLQGGSQYANSVDIFTRAPSLTPRADPQAQQTLANARIRSADAARRVTLDEEALNKVLANGKSTALERARAEETLRLAKESSAKASQEVTAAEKKAGVARLATADSLFKSLSSQAHRAGEDAKAVERLYAEGLSAGVVQKIEAQNANAPGTLESVAKTLTPKLAAALNQQFHQLSFDGSFITGSPAVWEAAGKNRALNFMAGVEAEFNTLSAPVLRVRTRIQRQGRLGSGVIPDNSTPTPSRTRQRALSGSNSMGGP